MCVLAIIENPDEMPHNAAFHLGLYCLLKQNQSSENKIQYFFLCVGGGGWGLGGWG